MQNVKVESSKTYQFGFILTEQEIRRIVSVCKKRYKAVDEDLVPLFEYVAKFRDNSILRINNSSTKEDGDHEGGDLLDKVLELENSGEKTISRLEIKSKLIKNSDYSIGLVFKDLDSKGENGIISISQVVTGLNRDWVDNTQTMINERILKIKRWVPNQIFSKNSGFYFPLILFFSIILLSNILDLYLPNTKANSTELRIHDLDSMETLYNKGDKKIEEIYLTIERKKLNEKLRLLNESRLYNKKSKKNFGILIFLLTLILVGLFMTRYYLPYNFCWGDYDKLFRKRESVRKKVFVVVIVGTIVSVLGGVIANYINK